MLAEASAYTQCKEHAEAARQAAIDAEMQQAELRRTMRSAELQRQAELEAINARIRVRRRVEGGV